MENIRDIVSNKSFMNLNGVLFLNKINETFESIDINPIVLYFANIFDKVVSFKFYRIIDVDRLHFTKMNDEFYTQSGNYCCIVEISQILYERGFQKHTKSYCTFYRVSYEIETQIDYYVNGNDNVLICSIIPINMAYNLKTTLTTLIKQNSISTYYQPIQKESENKENDMKQNQVIDLSDNNNVNDRNESETIITKSIHIGNINTIQSKKTNDSNVFYYIALFGGILGAGYIVKHYLFET